MGQIHTLKKQYGVIIFPSLDVSSSLYIPLWSYENIFYFGNEINGAK
jgi:hypothetical protein